MGAENDVLPLFQSQTIEFKYEPKRVGFTGSDVFKTVVYYGLLIVAVVIVGVVLSFGLSLFPKSVTDAVNETGSFWGFLIQIIALGAAAAMVLPFGGKLDSWWADKAQMVRDANEREFEKALASQGFECDYPVNMDNVYHRILRNTVTSVEYRVRGFSHYEKDNADYVQLRLTAA